GHRRVLQAELRLERPAATTLLREVHDRIVMPPPESDPVDPRVVSLPVARQLHPERHIQPCVPERVLSLEPRRRRLVAAAEPSGIGNLADEWRGFRRGRICYDREERARSPPQSRPGVKRTLYHRRKARRLVGPQSRLERHGEC